MSEIPKIEQGKFEKFQDSSDLALLEERQMMIDVLKGIGEMGGTILYIHDEARREIREISLSMHHNLEISALNVLAAQLRSSKGLRRFILRENGEYLPEFQNPMAMLDIKRMAEEMKEEKERDHLTGLLRREEIIKKIEKAAKSHLVHCETDLESKVHVAFIDLDGFKSVNDTYGHQIGDELLCAVSSQIKALIRDKDSLGRYGGDEFLLLLDQCSSEDAKKILERINEKLKKEFDINGRKISISASIGVKTFDPRYMMAPPEEHIIHLIKRADQAMYKVKNSGKGAVCFFSEEGVSVHQNGVIPFRQRNIV